MPVARSEQGLATIHDSVWRARTALACPHDHESCGDQDPCLERTQDGDPHRDHFWPKKQDPFIIENEDPPGVA
eukprot:scaffold61195_cov49-Phaeocystis_antarctica.AAC.2